VILLEPTKQFFCRILLHSHKPLDHYPPPRMVLLLDVPGGSPPEAVDAAGSALVRIEAHPDQPDQHLVAS
jgi:hypothetical protein